jgi:predicted TIM-barrel fold metal-dependent hydrolase
VAYIVVAVYKHIPSGALWSEEATRMGMPDGIGIVDTLIGFPHRDMRETYAFITRQTKDRESNEEFAFPAEYMFKDIPEKAVEVSIDPVTYTLEQMDRWGIEIGLVGVGDVGGAGEEALRRHPDRFVGSVQFDPNQGMASIRHIVRQAETHNIRAITAFPAGTFPQVAINDKKMYPLYAKAIELGLPVFCTAGVPGPRVRMAPQQVELIDEVMYDFPDLVFVTRHGCEPWTDLAWKLMLKWPGLHYSTSAFAPRYYPASIVKFANTRGADRIIYAGYFPMGLSLERIMTEMRHVPFRDAVWPKFLRGNALRVLGLES